MVALHPYSEINTSQPTLVLIHAFPLSSKMYESALKHLHLISPKHNYILVDLPGFGSAPLRNSWTLRSAMRKLHSRLHQLGISTTAIGGTSMGGYAALAYYREFPDKVTALILSNTKAEADTEEGRAGRETFAKDVLQKGHEAVYMRMLHTLTSKTTVRKHPEMLDYLKSAIGSASPEAIASALRAMAKRDDSCELLPSIKVPVLVITGEGDELIKPEVTKHIADSAPNATYREITGAGHLTPLEAPEEWAAIVADFLS